MMKIGVVKNMLHVITVVDSISTTSMPVNEFVLYRSRKGYECRETLFVAGKQESNEVEIPQNVDIFYFGMNIILLRKLIRDVIDNSDKQEDIIFHLHHSRSAILFFIASIGLGIEDKTVFTVHSTFSDRNLEYKITSALCAYFSRYLIFVSSTAYQSYSQYIKRKKNGKMGIIINGVDYERIDCIRKPGKERCKCNKRLVYVARFIPLKNHQFLIRLIKLLPDYELVLIGKEDKNQTIRELARQEGVLHQITFTGTIAREYVFELLSECDIYLSPSLIEGMPVSVLEAMSQKLLTIVSDIGPHREIEMYADIDVLPLNIDVWKSVIQKYEKMKEDELNIKKNNLRKSVEKHFSLKVMNDKYISLFHEVIRQSKE